jgi:hypothetical protein
VADVTGTLVARSTGTRPKADEILTSTGATSPFRAAPGAARGLASRSAPGGPPESQLLSNGENFMATKKNRNQGSVDDQQQRNISREPDQGNEPSRSGMGRNLDDERLGRTTRDAERENPGRQSPGRYEEEKH